MYSITYLTKQKLANLKIIIKYKNLGFKCPARM